MAPALLNNRYRTIRHLGSGGFGETFLAEDTYMPSARRCVIKQLKPATGSPEIYQLVRDRFQREAAVLEELGSGSSQIPNLYAYFSEGGQFYLVQEWIEGVTLSEKVRAGGRLSENEVRAMVLSLLPVLDYIHSKGIVHRDIKPDNIILRQRDGLPVLIDFGAVKEAMGTVVNSRGNPTSSIVIGTPGFMPSEQAAGRPIFSSDLYALALTAIFPLTGRTPQELEIDPHTGEFVWQQHATHISPEFVAALDKAIQYHPRDRYPNAPAMLSALQSVPGAVPAPAADMFQIETVALSKGGEEVPPPASPPNPAKPIETVALSRSGEEAPPPASPASAATPAGGEAWHKPALIGGIVGALALTGLVVARPKPLWVGAGAIGTSQTPNPSPNRPGAATVTVEIQEVKFNLGATGETVTGIVAPGQIKRYLVNSAQGQLFTVVILRGDVSVAVSDPLNRQMGTASGSNITWSGILPSSGNYNVEITSKNNSEYQVRIEVVNAGSTPSAGTTPSEPAVSKPSPTQAVRDYYSNLINNRQYEKGWGKLSENFKGNNSFESYIDWWNQVERVEIQSVKLVESGAESAVVDVGLGYIMKNGEFKQESQRFSMVWDAATSSWLIDGTSYK